MLDLKTLQKRLADMSLPKVAVACELSYNTVRKVADGDTDIMVSTQAKLSDYFMARDEA